MRTSAGPLRRPLQGDALSSQPLVASLKLGVGLRVFLLRLQLVGEFFIFLSSFPAKVCRSWFAEAQWDLRVLTDFVEARTRGRA
ncbi:hypothetical protein CRG98_007799 [Punica granatum]|uniref:Uncharacterized protein n=1 Tax=Punica granatum TaxID=22663 RepID=A0A2I0KTX1_PUNGR|nr:hypothetical protein CRG98_007799 [Punica granatum]